MGRGARCHSLTVFAYTFRAMAMCADGELSHGVRGRSRRFGGISIMCSLKTEV